MAKVDQIVASLQKLYAKRTALGKQILSSEKKLAAEANAPAKKAKKAKTKAKAKKPAAKASNSAEKPLKL
jgi:hypothetical protein